MIIQQSNVGMASQHQAMQRLQQNEQLQSWVGPRTEAEINPSKAETLPKVIVNDCVEKSPSISATEEESTEVGASIKTGRLGKS
jgi:hypothetical protein